MTIKDQDQLNAVSKRVIDMYTFQGTLFTSLDVSNAVKQTLPELRHREIAPVVRQMFDDDIMGANYTRTMIDVMAGGARGKPAEAWLYHLTSASPDDYGDDQRNQLAIVPVAASATDAIKIDESTTELTIEVGVDGRGRLPKSFLENAGIKTQRVRVDKQGSALVFAAVIPGDVAAGAAAVLTYMSPDQLHIPADLLTGFDTGKEIKATQKSEDGTVVVDGTPK
jgi:hypothetical protein